MSNLKQKQTLQQGYEKFVVKNEQGCWGWTGCQPKNPGYGQFRYGMKKERAHRASWRIHFGEIPRKMCVLHKCDNRICSRPDHLFLGTSADNIHDMMSKNRGNFHFRNKAKLNIEIVKKIKQSLASGMRGAHIAKLFQLDPRTISSIKHEKSWRSI